MLPLKKNVIFITTILIFLLSQSLSASMREIELKGLKVFSSKELHSTLKLKEFEERKIPLSEVINRIGSFYTKRGFDLLRINIIQNTPEKLVLYIDEGELGKIIIHNLSSYYSLKVRQQINAKNKIYNRIELEKNIDLIKKKYKINDVRAELKPVKEFDDTFFQIKRDLKSLDLGFTEIELFDKLSPLYDLHIYVEKIKEGNLLASKSGFGFKIDYKFSSLFIPKVSWYKKDFLGKGDNFNISLASALDFGFKNVYKDPKKGAPNIPPKRTYSEIKSEYLFTPINSKIFTPLVKARVFHNAASRPDLGLEKFQYVLTRAVFAPGFTFLNNLNIHGGFGMENIFFFDSSVDSTSSDHIDIKNKTESFPFTELQIKHEPIPIRIGNRIDKNMVFYYRELFHKYSSSEIEFNIDYDFEFKNLSILSIKSMTNLFFRTHPFHHQNDINSSYFKGFTGKDYYSGKQTALSMEYRFSIDEDFIYTGFFCDLVFFKASGFEISGKKTGIIAGPTIRMLFYDQFELIAYLGRDILLPDKTSQNNIGIHFRKKW